jgi:FkbM family methyltransferase
MVKMFRLTAMLILKRIIRKFVQDAGISAPPENFFKLSPTCQIPKLDIIYEQYFGRRTYGCFVEVGAFDGEYASNTSRLADIGWKGFYIEPVPEYFEKCVARHKDNKNIKADQCAIGSVNGKVEIHVGGPLSTISEKMRVNFETLDWAKGNFDDKKIEVTLFTLNDYLLKNRICQQFELLVVDVEGYEWEVFRNFDIKTWQPQMIIIELHDQNDDYFFLRENCNKLVNFFDVNGYKVIFKDFTNTIYVPKNASPNLTK